MGAKLALAYRQKDFRAPAEVSPGVAKALPLELTKVISLTARRRIDPEAVLRSILGEGQSAYQQRWGTILDALVPFTQFTS